MRLTHREKVAIAITVVTIVAVFGVMFGLFFYFLFNTSPTVRRKMLSYYSDDSNYIEVSVTLTNNEHLQAPPTNKQAGFWIGVEYDDPYDRKQFDEGGGFCFPATVYDMLIANGLELKEGVKCKITAAPRIWWDGGIPFAVAIRSADGQTEYLDYETGKEKLLYYIENDMD